MLLVFASFVGGSAGSTAGGIKVIRWLLVYKQANADGTIWKQYVVDNRFEHHDGAKVVELWPGQLAIISHGWADSRYVHLWLVE